MSQPNNGERWEDDGGAVWDDEDYGLPFPMVGACISVGEDWEGLKFEEDE